MTKQISFYWAGSKMSWLRYLTLKSFTLHNPSWKVRLFVDSLGSPEKRWGTPEQQDFFKYTGPDYFDEAKKLDIEILEWKPSFPFDWSRVTPSQRSNFFKWELLSYGGVYADMDILFMRPIDGIFEEGKGCSCGLTWSGVYSIGFMFADNSGGVFRYVLDNTIDNFELGQYQGAGVIPIYKKWPTFAVMKSDCQDIFNIPMDWFYHFDSDNVHKIFLEDRYEEIRGGAYGLHWYAGHHLAQAANNRGMGLGEEKNTIGAAIREILKT